MKAVEHFIRAIGGRRARLQMEQALKQALIGRRLFHQQRHIFFQHVDMVTRPQHMPLDQRNGAAHRMRDADMLYLRCITNKELRILQQIIYYRAVVERCGEFLLFFPDLFHR